MKNLLISKTVLPIGYRHLTQTNADIRIINNWKAYIKSQLIEMNSNKVYIGMLSPEGGIEHMTYLLDQAQSIINKK